MDKEKNFQIIITKTRVTLLIAGLVYFAVVIYLRLTSMISENIYAVALFGGVDFWYTDIHIDTAARRKKK
jgi:hypothetical protein